jgi:hypothetical protein
MIWLIEIALFMLLAGGSLTLLNRSRGPDQREALTMRRVDAYIETIRRERSNAALVAMSDSELRDLLHSGARNLRVAEQRRGWIVLGGGAVSLACASAMGSQEGWVGFFAAAALGALVTYGVSEYLIRQMRAPLKRFGIDTDRLSVK